jgi:predicted ABC-type ATPase
MSCEVISIQGPMGSGKSSLSKKIFEKYNGNIYYINVDEIKKRFKEEDPYQDKLYSFVFSQLKYLIKNNISVIVDKSMNWTRVSELKNLVNSLECKLRLIVLDCTFEKSIERVTARNKDKGKRMEKVNIQKIQSSHFGLKTILENADPDIIINVENISEEQVYKKYLEII